MDRGEHSPSYMFPTQSGNQHVPDSRRVCDGLATPSLVFTIRAVCVNALARICAGAIRVTARAKIWHTSEWRAILSAGQQTAPARFNPCRSKSAYLELLKGTILWRLRSAFGT